MMRTTEELFQDLEVVGSSQLKPNSQYGVTVLQGQLLFFPLAFGRDVGMGRMR
jgi:hypothetical protein